MESIKGVRKQKYEWGLLETIDIFQQAVSQHGEIIGVSANDDEVTIHINGHKGTFTRAEAKAFANAIKTMAQF